MSVDQLIDVASSAGSPGKFLGQFRNFESGCGEIDPVPPVAMTATAPSLWSNIEKFCALSEEQNGFFDNRNNTDVTWPGAEAEIMGHRESPFSLPVDAIEPAGARSKYGFGSSVLDIGRRSAEGGRHDGNKKNWPASEFGARRVVNGMGKALDYLIGIALTAGLVDIAQKLGDANADLTAVQFNDSRSSPRSSASDGREYRRSTFLEQ